jgi:hypothetical protein
MSEQAPAGWYPDQQGMRYWDGQQWTEHVQPSGGAEVSNAVTSPQKDGAFAKLRKAATDKQAERRAAKEDLDRRQAEAAQAAGALITSGVFGTSTIEIYEGGYVRVASWGDGVKGAQPKTTDKNTPYERLLSIKFTQPTENKPSGMSSAIEGAISPAMAGILKGGAKAVMKGSVPGLVVGGIAHVATAESRTSFLTITTDRQIHTLTNQVSNGLISTVKKGQIQVGAALESAGNSALGVPGLPDQALSSVTHPAVESQAAAVGQPAAAPTLSERLRELAELHKDGILSDEEFAAAKAKLLGGL